jgi:MFS family permease
VGIKKRIINYYPAFTHRNFRLFWTGQVVSLIGTWMQNAALSWLVYSITNDRFLLGLMTAVQFLPFLFFSLYAGFLIDHYPKRKIIILTQSLQLVTASALFILVYFNQVKYPYILIIMFIVGLVQTFDNPARQTFVVEMVEGRDHLLNAIALNSAAFNGARLVGPALAGMTMANLGAKWCFFLNAISYIAVLTGLLKMIMEDKISVETKTKSIEEIKDGIKYIINTPKLLYTFISLTIIPTFCINFNILIPILTKDTLKLQEGAFGVLLSSLGLGALISALSVAAKGTKEKVAKFQLAGAFGLSISLVILGLINSFFAAIIMLIFCGFFMIMYNTTSNSILQFNSPDHMRGRIMGVHSLVFGGLIPFGSVYAGASAKFFGPQKTFIISGLICFCGFLLLFMRRKELAK